MKLLKNTQCMEDKRNPTIEGCRPDRIRTLQLLHTANYQMLTNISYFTIHPCIIIKNIYIYILIRKTNAGGSIRVAGTGTVAWSGGTEVVTIP